METSAFKTKSEIRNYEMARVNGNNQYKARTVIALDGGYSSVKGVSQERVFIFPSFAKKTSSEVKMIGQPKKTDIQFRNNETGEVWLVGDAAINMMDQTDIETMTDKSLYNRYRYDSEIYKVIMMTGMAIGLWGTPPGNEIFLQTGLPAKYKESDSEKLIKALSGSHNISIKIGPSDWQTFSFVLGPDNINVMEQPMGTLFGAAIVKGKMTREGLDILNSSSLVLDIGFGTEDVFSVRSGMNNSHQTYVDTAMKSVFETTIQRIQKQCNTDAEIKVFELQSYLNEGEIPIYNVDSDSVDYVPFAGILNAVNEELCDKSIERLKKDYENLLPYKYLFVTGGTGESRFEKIKKDLSGFKKLQILPGNKNDTELPFYYSNVLGYYNYRILQCLSEERKATSKETNS